MATLNIKNLSDLSIGSSKARAELHHRSLAQEVTQIVEDSVAQPDVHSILELRGLGERGLGRSRSGSAPVVLPHCRCPTTHRAFPLPSPARSVAVAVVETTNCRLLGQRSYVPTSSPCATTCPSIAASNSFFVMPGLSESFASSA